MEEEEEEEEGVSRECHCHAALRWRGREGGGNQTGEKRSIDHRELPERAEIYLAWKYSSSRL